MRKLLFSLIITFGYLDIGLLQLPHEAAAQQKPIPSYAKWGTLAMKKTKERYPNANIIDYLHVGRVTGPHSTTEKFKLWLKDNQKEFGVFVDIEFNPSTNEVIKTTFKETTR
ncbi:YqzG/YhdC family protein [Neobacillus cucumis]|uniref:YqzG/YhdC family protein n=1 Tax=Neobacillus cucumis TaxID=1740721 RepID=UPI002E224CD4|nr:YqzG/YhdC family protein [Neobacillus cucumis]